MEIGEVGLKVLFSWFARGFEGVLWVKVDFYFIWIVCMFSFRSFLVLLWWVEGLFGGGVIWNH